MKKQVFPILLKITCVFAAFTVGFFVGRNTVSGDVQISVSKTAPIYADNPPLEGTAEVSAPAETVVFPIDINSATQEALMVLPGIGETLAQRILDYRTENGSFVSGEGLLNVDGIGAGKLEEILDLITTGG